MRTYEDRVEEFGGPRLVDSLLVYMDALGTEASVAGPPEAIEQRFQGFRRAWTEAKRVSGLDDSTWVTASTFSDLVVCGLPIRDDGEIEFGSLVTTASLFQCFLAIEGIFVRGAFARGNAWIDQDMTYGPALVEAHKIEQESALYPRVVLSGEVEKCVRSYASYYGGDIRNTPQHGQLLLDGAGVLFVDYLQTVFVTPDESQQIETMEQHRLAVVSGMFDTRFNPSAQDKMYWSSRYHNYFASTHFSAYDDLLIEAVDPRLEFFKIG